MLGALLRTTAAREPDTVAFVEGDRRLTYAEWDRLSDHAASALWAAGARPGDVVGILLPGSTGYPIAYLGAAKIGCVTAGINPRFASPEIEHVLAGCGARTLVTDDERFAGRAISVPLGNLLLQRPAPPDVGIAPDDPVALVHTSGTTGFPRSAVFTARALEAVMRIDASIESESHPRSIQGIPMAHMGFMTKIGAFIARAGTKVLLRRWSARAALEAIARERLTEIGGVPTQMLLMMGDDAFARTDLATVTSVVIGGAPAAPEAVRAIREAFGAPVTVRYSCTELAVCTSTRTGDADEVVAETVGRPMPEVDLMIARPDGDGVGEICARSPAMMRGYARGDAAIDEHGYFHTGDLGRLDGAGNLRITGRAKEMYIRGGYNVYPLEIENALLAHPAVTAAAVFGVPDDVLGERGLAIVATAADPGELRAFLRARVADYKVPDVIEVRSSLPATSMFKVDKRALRAELGLP